MVQTLIPFPNKVQSVTAKEAIDWFDSCRSILNGIVISTSPLAGGTLTGAVQYRTSDGGFGGDDDVTVDGTGLLTADRASIAGISMLSKVISANDITIKNTSVGGLTLSNVYDSIITIGRTYDFATNPNYQTYIQMQTQANGIKISAPPNSQEQLYFNLPAVDGEEGEFLSWEGTGSTSIMSWGTINSKYSLDTAPDKLADSVLSYDNSSNVHKRVLIDTIVDMADNRAIIWYGL